MIKLRSLEKKKNAVNNVMDETIKFICCYFICLLFVSVCWIGLEYVFEGCVHISGVDGFVAAILGWFVADRMCD